MSKQFKYKTLFGKRYPGTRLTVIDDNDELSRDTDGVRRTVMLNCICDCGNLITVKYHDLVSGNTRSCGCYQKDHPSRLMDLTGMTFGKLKVLYRVGKKHHLTVWHCRCECGNEIDVKSNFLRNHKIEACNRCEPHHGPYYKHGDTGTRLYRIYTEMIYRCTTDKSDSYDRYGARGITVCDEWQNKNDGYTTFRKWALSHGYSDELSIDRIDNDGPYAPWNCRWVTQKVQTNNTHQNVYITFHGVIRTRKEWCELLGVSYNEFLGKERLRRNKMSQPEIIEYFMNKYKNLSYHNGQFYDKDGFVKLLPKLH